jgi:radical SAM superfamily enzyme with C-terminal helix-hairpin-helix motif
MTDRIEKAKIFLVGKTVDEVREHPESDKYIQVETETCSVREVCIDGFWACCTMDYREDRVNVITEKKIITDVKGFY